MKSLSLLFLITLSTIVAGCNSSQMTNKEAKDISLYLKDQYRGK